jgi:hypothetical protein
MKHLQIFEFFNNEVSHLMQYLKMSEEEKLRSLPYDYSYMFPEFWDEVRDDQDEELVATMGELMEDNEYGAALQHITDHEPELYDQFCNYIKDDLENGNSVIPDAEKPTWFYLDFDRIVKKDTWLVHITSEADVNSIYRNGFTKGVYDMSKLGLTVHISDYEKNYGGYNFAYTLEDFIRYGKEGERDFRYGTDIVIFRAAGIRCWHNSDQEFQVIFWGKDVTDLEIISYDYADGVDVDPEEEFTKVKPSFVRSFIKSHHTTYKPEVLDMLSKLSLEPNFMEKIQEWNPNAYNVLKKYFMKGFQKEDEAMWHITDDSGKVLHREEQVEDIIKWYINNHRHIK